MAGSSMHGPYTDTYAVEPGAGPPRYLASLPNTSEAVRKLVRQRASRSSSWCATRLGRPATGCTRA